jgi:hypothetical protein
MKKVCTEFEPPRPSPHSRPQEDSPVLCLPRRSIYQKRLDDALSKLAQHLDEEAKKSLTSP